MAVKGKPIRLGKAARDFNVGTSTIVEFLSKKGFDIETNPNAKLTPEMFEFVEKEYQTQKAVKEEAEKIGLHYSDRRTITIEEKIAEKKRGEEEDVELEIEEEVMITDTSMKKEVVKPAPVETAKPDKPEPEPVIEQEKEVVSEDKIEEPKEKKVEKPDTESTQEVEPVEKVADQEVEEK